jgi:hypothetical protein
MCSGIRCNRVACRVVHRLPEACSVRHDTMAHRTRAAYIGDSARRLTRTWWRCYDVCHGGRRERSGCGRATRLKLASALYVSLTHLVSLGNGHPHAPSRTSAKLPSTSQGPLFPARSEATMLPLSPAETEQRNPEISRVQPSGSRPVGCLTPTSPPVSLAVASLRPHT